MPHHKTQALGRHAPRAPDAAHFRRNRGRLPTRPLVGRLFTAPLLLGVSLVVAAPFHGTARAQQPREASAHDSPGPSDAALDLHGLDGLIAARNWGGLQSRLAGRCGGALGGCFAADSALARRRVAALVEEALRRETRDWLQREDLERPQTLVGVCESLTRLLDDAPLATTCAALRRDAAHRDVSALLTRVEEMLTLPELRRFEAWVRAGLRKRGFTAATLAATPGGHALVRTFLRDGPPSRWPSVEDLASLTALLGTLPPSLADSLADVPVGAPPWATIREARREILRTSALLVGSPADSDTQALRRVLERLRTRIARLTHAALSERRRSLAHSAPTEENAALRAELAAEGTPPALRHRSPVLRPPPPALRHPPPSPPRALGPSARNRTAERVGMVVSPYVQREPAAPMRVRVASWEALDGIAVGFTDRAGHSVAGPALSRIGGSGLGPFLYAADWTAPSPGRWLARLTRGAAPLAEQPFWVGPGDAPALPVRVWTPGMEALFSAWVTTVFGGLEGRVWVTLSLATADRIRNFLWNHRGAGEDLPPSEGGLNLQPDCADLPAYVRTYFAWKLGLPGGYLRCDAAEPGLSSCEGEASGGIALGYHPLQPDSSLDRLRGHFRLMGVYVDTSNLREDHWADQSLLYPVAVTRESLRPGTVYVDPHGHVLMVVRWLEGAEDGSRVLLAIDAQPGGYVTLKRFWPGSFVFTTAGAHAGAGFKAFRPFRRDAWPHSLVTNADLEVDAPGAPLSYEQSAMSSVEFYDRMDALLAPVPRNALAAYRTELETVHQMFVFRAHMTDVGETWFQAHPGEVVAMPPGDGVFQSAGVWEDLATICRDLRLMVAVNLVRGFPEAVLRHPERFVLPRGPLTIRDDLAAQYASVGRELVIQYQGSSGTPRTRTLSSVLNEPNFLSDGYNPNDCAEHRWGDAAASTCTRVANDAQRARMREYAHWFQNGYGCD